MNFCPVKWARVIVAIATTLYLSLFFFSFVKVKSLFVTQTLMRRRSLPSLISQPLSNFGIDFRLIFQKIIVLFYVVYLSPKKINLFEFELKFNLNKSKINLI